MREPESPPTILVADDNPDNLKVMSRALKASGFAVRLATNGAAAMRSVHAQPPDLILLDVHMPEMDGYEVCAALKSDPHTEPIPIVFVSAMNEEFNKVRAFESGAEDYITKPIMIEELLARIRLQLANVRHLRESAALRARVAELENEVDRLSRELARTSSDAGPEGQPST